MYLPIKNPPHPPKPATFAPNLPPLDNSFELPITYKGKEHLLPADLITYGYSYKIEINVFDTIVVFEPDEERQFRAIINTEEQPGAAKVDKELLQLIAETLHSLFS